MEDIEKLKLELEKKTSTKSGKRTNSATKVVDAIQNVIIDTIINESTDEIFEQIRPALEKRMLETYGCIPTVKEIKVGERKGIVKGVTHEMFDTVLTIIAHGFPVYLTGPAGSGN